MVRRRHIETPASDFSHLALQFLADMACLNSIPVKHRDEDAQPRQLCRGIASFASILHCNLWREKEVAAASLLLVLTTFLGTFIATRKVADQ